VWADPEYEETKRALEAELARLQAQYGDDTAER
jgi:hypothetical protein